MTASADVLMEQLVRDAVIPVTKPAGFSRSKFNFHRRHGETVQVISLQLSVGNTAREKEFFVNVGIAFDAVCRLVRETIEEKVKEYDCETRGMGDRLEKFVEDTPVSWRVRTGEDIADTAIRLQRCLTKLAAELDSIDGIQAYHSHAWFKRFRPSAANARILYLLDDLDGAWREVRALTRMFRDREGLNEPAWWVRDLRLAKLKPRLKAED